MSLEKLAQIHQLLAENEEINVRVLFETSRSKRELILTFLAFLELVKETKITLVQRELFGEIYARKRTDSPLDSEPEDAGPPDAASDGAPAPAGTDLEVAETIIPDQETEVSL